MQLIAQPGMSTIQLLAENLSQATSQFDASIAYATFPGYQTLTSQSTIAKLTNTKFRFIVGIDWFRSEPFALDLIGKLPGCSVKIADGEYLISSSNCQPQRTFHPKAYSIKNATPTLLVGSANLSANGLQRSVELSVATSDTGIVTAYDNWFESQWRDATPWSRIRDAYHELYTVAKSREYVTTDDDVAEAAVLRLKWVTSERLRLLRASQHLWIDVGGLHNRDMQGLPGTDLQFSQMTRVFFGYPAKIVPGNTHLLDLPLTMKNARRHNRPMVFNKSSSMDRLSLPVPAEGGWPASYDYETLLFSKTLDGSFSVKMAAERDRSNWKRLSTQYGFAIEMSRREREWGVF